MGLGDDLVKIGMAGAIAAGIVEEAKKPEKEKVNLGSGISFSRVINLDPKYKKEVIEYIDENEFKEYKRKQKSDDLFLVKSSLVAEEIITLNFKKFKDKLLMNVVFRYGWGSIAYVSQGDKERVEERIDSIISRIEDLYGVKKDRKMNSGLCRSCGKKISRKSRFCSVCGAKQ